MMLRAGRLRLSSPDFANQGVQAFLAIFRVEILLRGSFTRGSLRVLFAILISSKNSRILDAKSRLKSANLG